MSEITIRETILREIENLPEAQQEDVLAFVRFLRIGLGDQSEVERHFDDALEDIRIQEVKREINDKDIENEIQAVRSGR